MLIRPEAEADVVTARAWYERQRSGLGAAFLLCLEEVFDRIDRTPELYVVRLCIARTRVSVTEAVASRVRPTGSSRACWGCCPMIRSQPVHLRGAA